MHAEIFESAENGTLKVKPPPPIPISCRTGLLGRSHPGFREHCAHSSSGIKTPCPLRSRNLCSKVLPPPESPESLERIALLPLPSGPGPPRLPSFILLSSERDGGKQFCHERSRKECASRFHRCRRRRRRRRCRRRRRRLRCLLNGPSTAAARAPKLRSSSHVE